MPTPVKTEYKNSGRSEAQHFMTNLRASEGIINNRQPEKHLSKRELEVLYYIAKGYSNKVILEKMYIATSTLDAHVRAIMRKVKIPGWANKRVWLAVNYKKFMEKKRGNGR